MKTLSLLLIMAFSNFAFADNKITVTIDELNNIDRGYSMEACGTAKHADGKKPLMVTLAHDQSRYTTLTDENGKWCTVIKRWTFNGNVTAVASTLDYTEKSLPLVK